MGHIKKHWKNIFNTKKKNTCHIPFGVEGWKLFENFQKRGGGYRNSEVLVILYVLFGVTELHFDTIFFQHFLT